MNKLIVTVFDSEEKAFEGLTALKTLHATGDISLYATAVLSKDENKKLSVKQVSDNGPVGTSVGMLSGAFIGMFGGPVGMAIGASLGVIGGMFYDIKEEGIEDGFVKEVGDALQDDKVAVICDAQEGWTTPVDSVMEKLGGIVFRKNRSEVVDEQLKRESEAINSELEELEIELNNANEETKASIQKQMAKAKEKGEAIKRLAEKKMTEAKAETDAKTKELDEQLKEAGKRKKEKLEKRKKELRESYDARNKKLNEVSEKASKYLVSM